MTREEELQLIAAHIERHGVYRARLGEASEQDPAITFRRYKKKKSKPKITATGKRRTRNAPMLAARERMHAEAGGLLGV